MLMGAKTYDGAKVPMHFRSWNESSQERKFSETNVTFAAGSESTKERKGHNSGMVCRMRKSCNQDVYIAYCLPLLASLIFFKL